MSELVPSKPCRDCGAAVGYAHDEGCDVARCLATGGQRQSCPGYGTGLHDCGRQVWDGLWPGERECVDFGWYSRFVPDEGWLQCGPDYPDASPDLDRLARDARWDRAQQRWLQGACACREQLVYDLLDEDGTPYQVFECAVCGSLIRDWQVRAAHLSLP